MYNLSAKELFFKVTETRGSRKVTVKHFFRLPTLQDWVEYYRGASYLGLSRGRDTFEVSDTITERDVDLWEKLIIRVEDYKYHGEDLMGQENWKSVIPISHKQAAISGFTRLWRKEEEEVEETFLDLGSDDIEVRFNAMNNVEGKAVYDELRFHFKSPEPSDYKQMSKLQSKMRLTRTRERNVSSVSVPSDVRPYLELFDRLIVKVEGFEYAGADVMKAENWKELIPAFHKREAVEDLFQSEFAEDEEGKA